ncbi:MAG: hypothetical protein HWD59_03490 [Coxiellaceae bacterium]|nr:MAG: hypothetical protein HWD59_03490 [Coxiellaceae bacterium]
MLCFDLYRKTPCSAKRRLAPFILSTAVAHSTEDQDLLDGDYDQENSSESDYSM